ncbi:hypothetical protein NEOKW01_0113 [Nematocida sp. AWRm80]|nr:hypothetical protein NEOKW01_0113 [Nematocida sp. AWRm80]
MSNEKRMELFLSGRISLNELISKWEPYKNHLIDSYILFHSLKITNKEEYQRHKRVLETAYNEKYIPGVFSAYIAIVLGNNPKRIKEGIIELMEWTLTKISTMRRIPELENRLILMIKGVSEKREDIKGMDMLLVEGYKKSSSEGKVFFVEEILKRYSHKILPDMVIEIDKLLDNINILEIDSASVFYKIAEYFPERTYKTITQMLSCLREINYEKELRHQKEIKIDSLSFTEEQNTIIPLTAISNNNTITSSTQPRRIPSTTIANLLNKTLNEDRLKIILSKAYTKLLESLRTVRTIIISNQPNTSLSTTDKSDGITDTKTNTRIIPDTTIRREKPDKNITESGNTLSTGLILAKEIPEGQIERLQLEDILLLAEICPELRIPPGTDLSKRILLSSLSSFRTLEEFMSHRVSTLLQVQEELSEQYEYYLGIVFKKNIPLVLSINLVNALIKHSYKGRGVNIAIQLSRTLKELEYTQRTERFKIEKTTGYTLYISEILTRIIQMTIIKKKDLLIILNNIIYLLTVDDIITIRGISLIIEHIIQSYTYLDKGIDRSLYGMPSTLLQPMIESKYNHTTAKEDKEDNINGSTNRTDNINGSINGSTIREDSTKDNDNNNTMVICARVFDMLNKYDYSYTCRESILSLITTMIRSTDDFLIDRFYKDMFPYISSFYLKNSSIPKNTESNKLRILFSILTEKNIPYSSYHSYLSICIVLFESRIDNSEDILHRLYKKDKYSILYSITYLRNNKKGKGISRHTLNFFQRLFTK